MLRLQTGFSLMYMMACRLVGIKQLFRPFIINKTPLICSARGHYLKQCWPIVIWTLRNKNRWHKMPTFSVKRMGSSANWRPLCSYFNVNFNQVMCIFQPLWYRYVRCVTSSPVQYELSVETHLKPKSREISLAHKSFPSYPTVLNICTEHGNGTAVLCTTVLNDWVM